MAGGTGLHGLDEILSSKTFCLGLFYLCQTVLKKENTFQHYYFEKTLHLLPSTLGKYIYFSVYEGYRQWFIICEYMGILL